MEEIRSTSFPSAMRGYDREAVDSYVERVNRLIAELEISRSPESAVKHAVAQVSEETRGILERAHETAEEITARSRAKADDRIQQAEREAAEIREGAEARVHELDADAEAIWAERLRLILAHVAHFGRSRSFCYAKSSADLHGEWESFNYHSEQIQLALAMV